MTEITINSLGDLERAAREFIAAMPQGATVYAFTGDMGAGKTTFIAALCRALGVSDDAMGSPTFSIVNEYRTNPGGERRGRIYHFDCYRLEDEQEGLDIGAEDYLYSGDLCLVEWPDRIEGLLPDDTVEVEISADPDTGVRTLRFQA